MAALAGTEIELVYFCNDNTSWAACQFDSAFLVGRKGGSTAHIQDTAL